ncbi:bifunctional diaminohydroxyphosphoribosylaminopyrimidine deaminase/5-amino-6-(5-phosphoribosylamino)uracil reductase RibD [Candidatus Ichthyocystis sparus]|nr:bifunctional diaminohydroxyphosphoribosylaminopyrimidine deaminase/5-amino-6-(5-phosphoribosylamino)uracil reductase RibD [Candidatus Ichthyocystis hellenicum]
MNLALSAAEDGGLYTSTPNPRVGCVLVKGGEVLSVGCHRYAGQKHAEIDCLDKLEKSHLFNSTLYITLEPCHHHGLTPPCINRIIEGGVSRVVISSLDPNPLVCGKSIEKLRSSKITTQIGLLSDKAIALNCGFFKRMLYGKPWIRLKMAFSLDGRTALSSGESQWITNEKSRKDAHHWRARSCGIITGIGTVLSDDPLMNIRHVETTRQTTLVILDSNLKIPISAKCISVPKRKIIVAHTLKNSVKQALLSEKSVSTVLCPEKDGHVDLKFLLEYLGKQEQMNEITVEAGTTLSSSFYHEECDELLCYVSSKILGHESRPLIKTTVEKLSDAKSFNLINSYKIGNDIRLIYHHQNCILQTYSKKWTDLVTQ